uniref:Transposable element Tcb2 transposase n=1 Tax=Bactrocera dorsalis TaxID=27457 RepID=A0A034WTK7_BACDO
MRTEISLETRKIIIDLKKKGKSLREIAQIVGRHHTTIKKIIDKFENFKLVENFKRSGRPKVLTEREERQIVGIVRTNPRSSAVQIAKDITADTGKSVSSNTIRRILHKNGFYGRRPRKKPFISKVNKAKRLDYARKYQYEDFSFWSNVLFTDESKFEISGGEKPRKIWRKPNAEFHDQNIQQTVKHGGGSVMVWGCFSAAGVGELDFIETTMNAKGYIGILKKNLAPSIAALGLPAEWIFQQDNDPKHKSNLAREFLLYNTKKQLPHPPQSPDLNPIENLWDHLDRQIRKRNVTSKETLKSALREEWLKISPEYTKTLVESMPCRLKCVIKAKGRQTKY